MHACLHAWAETYLLFSGPWTWIYTISSPDSYAFGLRLNCTTCFTEFPACRWQIVGLLTPHNCINHFLIINLSLSLIFSVSFLSLILILLITCTVYLLAVHRWSSFSGKTNHILIVKNKPLYRPFLPVRVHSRLPVKCTTLQSNIKCCLLGSSKHRFARYNLPSK